jgi:L-ascorbate metabolism protein UlaG (beta-lactamase superfamily)
MSLVFKWLGGASWMLSIDGAKIVCDPVLCLIGAMHDYGLFKSRRINAPNFDEADFESVSIWLFTHGIRIIAI